MDPIENLNLQQILESTATSMLEERRASVSGLIKQLLQASEQQASEIAGLERQIAKKKESFAASTAKIAKLKTGDWSVLQEAKKQAPQQAPQPEE